MGHPAVDEIIIDDKKKRDRGWSVCGGRQSFLAARDLRWLCARINPFVAGLLLCLARIPFRVGFAQSQSSFLFHVRVNRDAERHDVERTLSLLEALGIPTEECERALDLPITAEVREEVIHQFRSLGVDTSKMLVGLHPGSVWATKRWSAEGFARLIGMLKERYPCEILLFGGPEDGEVIAKVQELCGGGAVSLVDRIHSASFPQL